MNLLLTEISWDAPEVLAKSLPANVLILNFPEGTPDTETFLQAHFGARTTGYVGHDADRHLRRIARKRLTVEVTVWE